MSATDAGGARGIARRLRQLASRADAGAFIHTLLPTVASLAVQVAAFVVTARGLGIADFGRYTALLAVAIVCADVAGLGATDVLVRAVARERARFGRYFGHLLVVLAATLPLAVLAGTVFLVAALGLDLPPYLVACGLAAEIALSRTAGTLEMIFVAHARPAAAGWVRLGAATLRLAIAVAYFVVAGGTSIPGWIATLAIAAVAAMAVAYLVIRGLYGPPCSGLIRDELSAGVALCLPHLATGLQNNLDRMILARFGTAADVGAYGAGTRVLQLGTFPLLVATRITYPRFFIAERRTLAAARAYAVRLVGPMLALGLVAAAGVWLGALALPPVLGEQYRSGVPVAQIVAAALPFLALQTPPADALVAAGLQSIRATIYLAATAMLLGAMTIGAIAGGVTGVAWSYVACQAVLAAMLWGAAFLHPGGRAPAHGAPMPEVGR